MNEVKYVLDSVLPNSLISLDMYNSKCKEIFSTLPNKLTSLNCSNTQITTLPTLPSSLTYLSFSGNFDIDISNCLKMANQKALSIDLENVRSIKHGNKLGNFEIFDGVDWKVWRKLTKCRNKFIV